MQPIALLAAGGTPAEVSLDGHPQGWRRTAADWDTGPRCLDRHFFNLVESGDMVVEWDGSEHTLAPGGALLVPPGRRFRTRAGRRPPAYWRLRIDLPAPWTGPCLVAGCQDLEPVVSSLVAEAALAPSPLRDAAVRGGLLVLLCGLARRADAADGRRLTQAQMAIVERFADSHPRATAAQLAAALGLTHDYATRLFRATCGRPPRRWLLERRIHAIAADLVDSQASLATLADRHGYDDLRVLGRQFRQVMGLPPGRFRARHQPT
jgi:AraC-like DNA-binding protein